MRKEGNVLFNDALNTFYLRLYGVRCMVKDHSDSERGNPLSHMVYSFRLTARVLLYAPSHRQDNTYHGFWYTSRGALAGTRNSSMGSTPWRIDPTTHSTMSERFYHGATSRSGNKWSPLPRLFTLISPCRKTMWSNFSPNTFAKITVKADWSNRWQYPYVLFFMRQS